MSSASFAFRCPNDTKSNFAAADLVVEAEVLRTQKVAPKPQALTTVEKATLQIKQIFKGIEKRNTEITIDIVQLYSAPHLNAGSSYILFLKRSRDDRSYELDECSEYYPFTLNMQKYNELITISK